MKWLIIILFIGCTNSFEPEQEGINNFTSSILSIDIVSGGLEFIVEVIKLNSFPQDSIFVGVEYLYTNDTTRVLSTHGRLGLLQNSFWVEGDIIIFGVIGPRLAHPRIGYLHYNAIAY